MHTRHAVGAVYLMKNSKGAHSNKYDITTDELAILTINTFPWEKQKKKCKRCGRDAECDKIRI
jgi:hypothetical protein